MKYCTVLNNKVDQNVFIRYYLQGLSLIERTRYRVKCGVCVICVRIFISCFSHTSVQTYIIIESTVA